MPVARVTPSSTSPFSRSAVRSILAVVATRTESFTSRPIAVESTYPFVAASVALVGVARPVILLLLASRSEEREFPAPNVLFVRV